MKRNLITALALLLVMSASAFAIDIAASDTARLDVVSRTSFGFDIDYPWKYGLSNDLTQLALVFGLAPYQRVSNRLNSPEWVGFIELTLFHLDLIKINKGVGYTPMGNMQNNRYQTGEFVVGLAKDNWIIQLNAAGNEPFTEPWNKGMQFINDAFKVSWAYLDSMVDIRRVKTIADVPVLTKRGEEHALGAGELPSAGHDTMHQFGHNAIGNIGDRFGSNISAEMVSAMYNSDNFGINFKLGTEYKFYSDEIKEDNANGLALGFDTVFTPSALDGFRTFFSAMTTINWETDADPDPIYAGTRIGYKLALNDDLNIEPWVGYDIGLFIGEDEVKNAHEFSFGLTMRWPGQSGWLTDYIINSDGRVFPGMSIAYKTYINEAEFSGVDHSIKFTLFEPRGDDGLFYMFGSEIIIDIMDLTGVTKDSALNAASYPGGLSILVTSYFDLELNNIGKIPGTFRPWTILYYDNLREARGSDNRISDFKIDLGLNLENAIQNTTFGLVWNSGSLIQLNRAGCLRVFVEVRM